MGIIRRLDRRRWLTWSASGVLAVWSALDFDRSRRGWGIAIGAPTYGTASAQEAEAPRILSTSTELEVRGQVLPVAAYAVVRGDEIAIVDTLVAGNAGKIEAVLQDGGLGWGSVKHVILTHFHSDHVGSLNDVLAHAPQAAIYAGAADIGQIESVRPITPVADGQEILGLQVVATPGHTFGHISVYDPVGSTLIIGDAAMNVGGNLTPHFANQDAVAARESLKKLSTLPFERGLFMHGDPIETGGSAAFERLVATAP